MFEDWAQVMGGILSVAGIPDFLGNLNEFYNESDTEGTAWRAFAASWWVKFGDDYDHVAEAKVADLHAMIVANGLSLPLGDKGDQSQKIRLGKLLNEARDRTFNVEIGEDKLRHTVRLKVVRGDVSHSAYTWKLTNIEYKPTI